MIVAIDIRANKWFHSYSLTLQTCTPKHTTSEITYSSRATYNQLDAKEKEYILRSPFPQNKNSSGRCSVSVLVGRWVCAVVIWIETLLKTLVHNKEKQIIVFWKKKTIIKDYFWLSGDDNAKSVSEIHASQPKSLPSRFVL